MKYKVFKWLSRIVAIGLLVSLFINQDTYFFWPLAIIGFILIFVNAHFYYKLKDEE